MKIAIEIGADGKFCGYCKLVSRLNSSCTWFDEYLEWGGEHNHLLKRCRQCIEATIERDGE